MRITNKILLVVSFCSVFFYSCDKIEEPFIENQGECGDASLPIPIKQILIEEFTGHQCGNCPTGDETVEMIKELYCDHIIPISIHAGSFADINETGTYTVDFRSDVGNEINTYYQATAAGIPNAIINRAQFDDTYTQNTSEWLTIVSKLLEEEPVLDILADTRINTETREIEIDVDVVFVNAMNNDLMLSLYFVEDSIVSWQKDYTLEDENIEFYSHNHVLRDAINGVWGDNILSGQVNAGGVKSKSYSYIIQNEWVIKNSSIILFVYKSDTKEILQATQAYIY